jgi:uncharacterized protein
MALNHPRTLSFRIEGPISREDLPGLCDRICKLLASSDAETAICDVSGVGVDAVAVDALARLQLAARRHGRRIRLCGSASPELLALVELMGLTDVLPCQDRTAKPQGGTTMASNGHRKIFVNLAVENLDRSVDFFKQLGFDFDPRFTDESATCMVVSDDAFVMLLVRDRFKDFTKKELADPAAETEAIMALSADSREEVDALTEKALAAGGSPASDPIEMDFMYSRSFQDPDGHIWELVWMDTSAVPAQ